MRATAAGTRDDGAAAARGVTVGGTSGGSSGSTCGRASEGTSGVRRDDQVCERILKAPDHYAALGVPRGASEAELLAAKRQRAREVHPDKNSSPLAAEAFKRLQAAHDVLSDPSKRRCYDVYGEEEAPRRPSHRHHYSYEGAGQASVGAALGAAMPFMLASWVPLLLMLMGSPLMGGRAPWARNAPGASFKPQYGAGGGTGQRQKPPSEADPILRLSRSNADVECGGGRTMGRLCVVLVQKTSARGARSEDRDGRERQVLEDLRKEASQSVKNSRGQAVKFTWSTVTAQGRWTTLLPPGHTLPWPVVLKASRAGLRAAAMPLPSGGGKQKRRLSEGLPRFLQDIAAGEVTFQSIRGNVSDLFH